jgi:hypothetical protein
MKPKTCKSNKNEYGIVRNLWTMNHFWIMVLHRKANFLMPHCFMGCRFLITLHQNTFECLYMPNSICSNHKCKVLIALQLGLHIERDDPMVKMKFNLCIIIPHYCNNKFALHMHTSTISTLIFNTFNTTIHQNTIFMVISYNHKQDWNFI